MIGDFKGKAIGARLIEWILRFSYSPLLVVSNFEINSYRLWPKFIFLLQSMPRQQ
jgi:hypothetical protein